MTNYTNILAGLNGLRDSVLDGKNMLASALIDTGINSANVWPNGVDKPHDKKAEHYMTFEEYAKLIRRLKNQTSMAFQFEIPSTNVTAYKRTLVLPINFPSLATWYNNFAKWIISNNQESDAALVSALASMPATLELTEDDYANEEYFITPTFIQEEFDEVNVEHSNTPKRANSVALAAETVDDAVYRYEVDWGDGTVNEFVWSGETNSNGETVTTANLYSYEGPNAPAIFHTYPVSTEDTKAYVVSIKGTFKTITNGEGRNNYTENGDYVRDNDGVIIFNGANYCMQNCLTKVVAWGNTGLTSMNNAFYHCTKLESIPIADLDGTFENLTNCNQVFRNSGLTSLPYDYSTKKGLFSNCKKITTFNLAFYGCSKITGSIPNNIFDGCDALTDLSYCFCGCSNISGDIPNDFFKGLSNVTNTSYMFENCSKMTGTIGDSLLAECPKLNTISYMFRNCTGISGTLSSQFFAQGGNITQAVQVFKNTNIDLGEDALIGLTHDNLNCREMFAYCTKIGSIPRLPSGKWNTMEKMFYGCTNATYFYFETNQDIMAEEAANLVNYVGNARGLFAKCTNLETWRFNKSVTSEILQHKDLKYDTFRFLKLFHGMFVGTINRYKSEMYKELYGINGATYFSIDYGDQKPTYLTYETQTPISYVGSLFTYNFDTHEYKICSSRSDYDSNYTLIGVIYGHEYIKLSDGLKTLAQNTTTSITKVTFPKGSTIASNQTTSYGQQSRYMLQANQTPFCHEYLLIAPFRRSNAIKTWVDESRFAEDLPLLENRTNVANAYLTRTAEGVYNNQYYNGLNYTDKLKESVDALDSTTLETYKNSNGGKHYMAIDWALNHSNFWTANVVNNLQEFKSGGAAKETVHEPFMADVSDLWDIWCTEAMLQQATNVAKQIDSTIVSANYAEQSWYWAPAEYSATGANGCSGLSAYCYAGNYKWLAYYVLPVLAYPLTY